MKRFFFILFILLFLVAIIVQKTLFAQKNNTSDQFWPIESVDTMKYSRDAALDQSVYPKIPIMVKQAADLHANYISIATPYDERFYPILKMWVDAARANHLHVWFRGNFSSWEGWFGYPKFNNLNDDHKMVHDFIIKHPELFQNGDIFTPVPEPENGELGDPRGSDQLSSQFNQFLVNSYNNCVESFSEINKSIKCGYFGMNGDIAKQVLTPETVSKIGNVVVIDHYVDSVDTMNSDLYFLENKFPDAKIVLGEFGAPIPDINGTMTDSQQASFIQSLLNVFYDHKDRVLGLNYWVLNGGSTALIENNGNPKQAATVLSEYYKPPLILGTIKDTIGNNLKNIEIKDLNNNILATTDSNGNFSFIVKANSPYEGIIDNSNYQKLTFLVPPTAQNQTLQTIELTPFHLSMWDKIVLFIKSHL